VEEFLQNLSQLNPLWIYLAIALIACVENVFPPFPSDVVIVAAGSLIGLGKIDFGMALASATTGSTLGFLVMYKIGDWFGDRMLETGRIRFIPVEQVRKVEGWFRKYGYALIVANRFLAGTRAVVSFFAGLSELRLGITALLSAVSTLVWSTILLSAGQQLGANWQDIIYYLDAYSKTVTSIVVLLAIVLIVHLLVKRSRNNGSAAGPADAERK
jgi:membrane protein DedA with SNARE-associated domain